MKMFQTILHGLRTIREDTRIVKSLTRSLIISSGTALIMVLLIPLLSLVMAHIEKLMRILEKLLTRK